jgi:hypothetical protein
VIGRSVTVNASPSVAPPQSFEQVAVLSRPTVAKTNLSTDVHLVLDGLSQHASLHDLAQTPALASELVTIAKGRGVSTSQLLATLDVAAKVCQRQRMASSAVRSGIVYKLVLELFDEGVARRSSA